LAQGEQGAQSSTQEHNIIAVVDWFCESILVCVQSAQDAAEDSVLGSRAGFEVAVEFQEFGEEREDEGEGYLRTVRQLGFQRSCVRDELPDLEGER